MAATTWRPDAGDPVGRHPRSRRWSPSRGEPARPRIEGSGRCASARSAVSDRAVLDATPRSVRRAVSGPRCGAFHSKSALFHHRDLERRVRELAPGADLVILQLTRLADYANEIGDTPFLVDFIDSLALNFEQRAKFDRVVATTASAIRGAPPAGRRVTSPAIGRSAVSSSASAIETGSPSVFRSRVADRLTVVPLVVPAQTVAARRQSDVPAERSSRRGRLVFTGNLGYFVNDDAIRWFLHDVWPTPPSHSSRDRSHDRRCATAAGVAPTGDVGGEWGGALGHPA